LSNLAPDRDDTPRPASLSQVEVVLADSRAALDFAYRQGVPRGALVRTASPALALATDIEVELLEKDVSPEILDRLDQSTLPFSQRLFEACGGRAELADSALVVARVALNYQTLVYKALALGEAEFGRPVATLAVETDSPDLDLTYNAPWPRLLAANPDLHVLTAPRHALPPMHFGSHTNASFLDRLRLEDWQSIGYRLLHTVFDRTALGLPRGTILIQSDNALLKETALRLALRGYALRSLRPAGKPASPLGDDLAAALEESLTPVVRGHLAEWVPAAAVAPLVEIFHERARDAVGRYAASLPLWRQAFDRLSAARAKAVIANYPMTPEQIALYKVCGERGLPLVTAQHGTSRELNTRLRNAQAYYENNSADLFFTYNVRAAELSNDDNRFARGRAVSVGMPESFLGAGAYRRRNRAVPPLFFVSTLQYMGNRQMIQCGGRDCQRAAYESAILDQVLARLPHPVLYKPYPAYPDRYLDGDPVLERARRIDNVTVYEEWADLRYLFPDSRVLITSGGMSTVGLCLVSGKPLVYIDIPDQVPLRPEVRAAFENSVFLFDGGAPSLHRELRDFLSRPLDEIDARWRERAGARAALIERYIASGGRGAGRRAARILAQALEHGRGLAVQP